MTEASASNYWISSTALSITLNAMGDADYIQANVASGAMIMCYMRNIDGLGYDAGHNYRRWNLIANPTYFNSTTEKYVYAAIPRKQQDNGTALIVFPSERVDIYGKSATEVQLGSEDYYYIFLGGVISPSVVGGVLQNRTWTQRVDTGKLASDEAIAAGGDNTWWIYNAVDDTVTFLKAIVRAAFDNIEAKYATVKNLILGGETLTGVANDETPKNSRVDVVTPGYLFGNSDDRYVRKDIDDRVSSILTFLNGVHFGDDFEKDLRGAGIYRDEQGSWHIDTDYIHARKKLTAEEVEVMKTSHIKGKVVNSAGGFVISRIEKIAGAWRCYFVQQDSEGRRVYNSMRKDDLALCETFNLIDNNGQTANHYWHRRVTDVGTDYVDIADNTNVDNYASGSDVPQVGDEVVQLGNLTYEDRQSAIIQSAAGEGSPYFKIIKGINGFTLPDPIFLFDNQKFEIRVENPANRGKYICLQDFLETMQGRINAVQQQSDKQLVIWFGDVVPTLTSEPANEWADDATKELHEHDIYYNRSYVETGGGRAYSFEKNQAGSFSWHEITDADVLKSLEAAKHAQDTADGKRRMFVHDQPAPPYDKGDQWSNATFEDKYNNDLLVCVRPKATGEPFDIEDWQSAQYYTTKQFEAEFNVGGKSISAVVKDLRTGLETVGMHLDGENSTFDIIADRFTVTTTTGKTAFFTEDGKLNANLIDAKAIVAKGIKAQTIDAEGAIFTNVTVTGSINATEGRIAGFRIVDNGLINENENGKFTNDAYVVFRNDPHSTFAGIGGNVLPLSSGIRAVARFENNDKTDQWGLGRNYAMSLSASNAEYNFAIVGKGHCSVRGNMEGYLAQKMTLEEGNIKEIDYNKGAKVLFENSFERAGMFLPLLPTLRNSIAAEANESFAVFIHIVQVGGSTIGDVLYGRNKDVYSVVKAEDITGGRQIMNQDGTKSTLVLLSDGRIKGTTISSEGTAITNIYDSGTEFKDYWMNSISFPQIYNNDLDRVKVIDMGRGDTITILLSYDGSDYSAYVWSANYRFI